MFAETWCNWLAHQVLILTVWVRVPVSLRETMQKDIRQKFLDLYSILKRETRNSSRVRVRDVVSHWAYQDIIDLGEGVIPFILEDKEGYFWDFALSEICQVDPVKESSYGDHEAIRQDWLDWVEKNLEVRL